MGKSLMTIATEALIHDRLVDKPLMGATLVETKVSLADYLLYNDGTDTRYELVEGVLTPMSLGTVLHSKVIRFLDRELEMAITRSHPEWIVLASLMSVQSPRGRRWDTARIPDLLVMSAAQYEAMTNGAVIPLNQNPPILVIEVVSPSTKTEDYRSKWIEYCALDISEYWIVDPIDACVTVCVLDEGSYTNYRFMGDEALTSGRSETIVSPVFPGLQLTSAQVLAGSR
jgi:Uma2 family endonuclease